MKLCLAYCEDPSQNFVGVRLAEHGIPGPQNGNAREKEGTGCRKGTLCGHCPFAQGGAVCQGHVLIASPGRHPHCLYSPCGSSEFHMSTSYETSSPSLALSARSLSEMTFSLLAWLVPWQMGPLLR